MKKTSYLSVIILFFSIANSWGIPTEQVQILARIHHTQEGIDLIRSQEGDVIPSHLQDKELEKIISSMRAGDEAIITGHISYQASSVETRTKLNPVFIIESIKPISLKRLGESATKDDGKWSVPLLQNQDIIHTYPIPVTTEVASAITLTSAMLLMNSLATRTSDQQGFNDLNQGTIIFAGTLFTGLFIYEQIRNQLKGKK